MSFQVHAKQHLRGIGGHHSPRAQSVEWLTPRHILKALGAFDLDPCAPDPRPWDMAARHYTRRENGLAQEWFGRIWLNPPYGRETWTWLQRLGDHGDGIGLVFARTETEGFHDHAWRRANALHFFRGRLTFHHQDGSLPDSNCGGPSVLVAFGRTNADRLQTCGLPGFYVDLR